MKNKNSNIVIASAKEIPLESSTVSIVASTKCFQHINEFDLAIREMYKVLKYGKILVCTNSNPFSNKQKKWSHNGVYNFWSNDQFINLKLFKSDN